MQEPIYDLIIGNLPGATGVEVDKVRDDPSQKRRAKCERQKVKVGTVAMDPEKLGRICEAPRPQNKRQVRTFLGLVGYYRKFVPKFAERATPLTDLTKKGCPNVVQWGAAQEQAFKDLRGELTKAPILRLPNLHKPFTVQTDASDTGAGATLLQEYADAVFPVMYASKKLFA